LYSYVYEGQSSYKNDEVWTNNAAYFGEYETDVCGGSGAEYHLHQLSSCLSEKFVNDLSSSHSSIYGWIIDGYPVYGPYNGDSLLATSCWKKRDYSSAITGCAGGRRTCQLVDQMNVAKGVRSLPSAHVGPAFTAKIRSKSGYLVTAANGAFLEDYYFDTSCAAAGEEFLDASNGHDHGDHGYHYHFTATFPYIVGPKFHGCVSPSLCANSVCSNASISMQASSSSCLYPTTRAPSRAVKITIARVEQVTVNSITFSCLW